MARQAHLGDEELKMIISTEEELLILKLRDVHLEEFIEKNNLKKCLTCGLYKSKDVFGLASGTNKTIHKNEREYCSKCLAKTVENSTKSYNRFLSFGENSITCRACGKNYKKLNTALEHSKEHQK